MNVLLIDYRSPQGHEPYLRIQIENLLEQGFNVKCILKEGYGNIEEISQDLSLFYIPSALYINGKGLKKRLSYIKILHYIKKRIDECKWDAIILTSYEVLSLSLYRPFKKIMIVNHNNINDVENNLIKRTFFKLLPKNYKHIVFNGYIADKVEKMTNIRPIIIPHGLPKVKFNVSRSILEEVLCKRKSFLFSPSKNSTEASLLEEFCNSVQFNNYLAENGLTMIIRRKIKVENRFLNNYHVIDRYLSNDEYYTLMTNSLACIICYGDSFKYRVSGTLFECMTLNIPALVSTNEALEVYQKHARYNMFFNSVSDIILELNKFVSMDLYYTCLGEIKSPGIFWKKLLVK